MSIRLTCVLAAAALVTVLSTQTYAKNTFKTPKAPISLTGCIQREADYRRQHDLGKGGFLGFGGGLGNEYVLINTAPYPRRGSGDCATATGGEAYELTGSEEGDLGRFVGERVAITGTRKAAEIDAVTGRPTGGRQAGYDLRLYEVDVESFGLAPVPTRTTTRLSNRPTVRRFQQQVNRNGSGQAPIHRSNIDAPVDQLPASASPLPLIGLIGLLSLAAGLTLRLARWRA